QVIKMPPSWVYAFGFTTLPCVGGAIAGLITRNEISHWYATLKKPSWCPSNEIFGPVWTGLYIGMGYGSYLVWQDLGGFNKSALVPLGLYGTQLILNWLWTPIFFGQHKIGAALIEIICLYGTAAATTVSWYSINKTAFYLMLPYMSWLTLASVLNYVIWRDNRDKQE
uniref:Translocator protein n=1 Tax=Callorhinchus milii TaxID=7868 RepID=A0A4W3K8K2_CALMI